MNPLQRYRGAQRRARELFEPFTRVHCAGCLTPCCRKPARVRPVDVILVQELGFRVHPGPEVLTGRLVTAAFGEAPPDPDPETGEPCDWLDERGCRFPADLRPFGCVAFICEPMRRALSPEALAEVEAAVDDLGAAHEALMAELQRSTAPQKQ